MSLNAIIQKLQNRVNELNETINASANFYNSRDAELKQLLQNHNTLVGQLNEAQTLLEQFTKEKAEADTNANAEADTNADAEHE